MLLGQQPLGGASVAWPPFWTEKLQIYRNRQKNKEREVKVE